MAAAPGTEMKRTLTMTGLTINAMALIAPGAFLWTTFQAQVVPAERRNHNRHGHGPGAAVRSDPRIPDGILIRRAVEHLPGGRRRIVLLLRRGRVPGAEEAIHYKFARLAKFIVGWVSHLYYWIYPGSWSRSPRPCRLHPGLFGVTLNQPARGRRRVHLLGPRRVDRLSRHLRLDDDRRRHQRHPAHGARRFLHSGDRFRLTHPTSLRPRRPSAVVLPHNFTNVLFQGTIAILLLVGFESVTALGAEAINPKRDVRRAVLLSLAIQGGSRLPDRVRLGQLPRQQQHHRDGRDRRHGHGGYGAAAAPRADRRHGPVHRRQDAGRDRRPLVLILAVTVLVALIGTTLACLNTGVRITYVMGRDKEVPGLLGMLHFRHATPHYGVIALAVISAVLGGYAVLSADNLLQITLASNTGTFLVYGMTNAIVLFAFGGAQAERPQTRDRAVAGLVANIGDARRRSSS
jgi:APA family basic amino acid/polyamine antiporter